MIPEYVVKILKHTDNLEREAERFVGDWQIDGFANQYQAKIEYDNLVIAIKIRKYCRQHHISTCKGSYFSTNATEHYGLWEIVCVGDIDSQADGIKWQWRKVDQLRNIRIQF